MPLIRAAVSDVQALRVKAVERSPDVRVVVDADHHLALAAPHELGHALVVLERKVDAVAGGLPIRWVHIVERVHSIITLGTVLPGQVLDIRTSEALPSCG